MINIPCPLCDSKHSVGAADCACPLCGKSAINLKETIQKVGAPIVFGADPGTTEINPIWGIVALAGAGLGAYHGWKRDHSVGWAIVWALLGGTFPVITIPVAFAQGFAKRA
jgi:hypothetical protein